MYVRTCYELYHKTFGQDVNTFKTMSFSMLNCVTVIPTGDNPVVLVHIYCTAVLQ